MPSTFSNHQFWLRGGRRSQNRRMDLTEETREQIAKCTGVKQDHPCKNPVFRCAKCGNYGCAQVVADKCTKQGFKNDICLACGAKGTRVPLMEEEFEEYESNWQEKAE